MQSVVGIFSGREAAEAAANALRVPEIARDQVSTLTPDMSRRDVTARVQRRSRCGFFREPVSESQTREAG